MSTGERVLSWFGRILMLAVAACFVVSRIAWDDGYFPENWLNILGWVAILGPILVAIVWLFGKRYWNAFVLAGSLAVLREVPFDAMSFDDLNQLALRLSYIAIGVLLIGALALRMWLRERQARPAAAAQLAAKTAAAEAVRASQAAADTKKADEAAAKKEAKAKKDVAETAVDPVQEVADAASRTCADCGQTITDEKATFCPKCGKPLA